MKQIIYCVIYGFFPAALQWRLCTDSHISQIFVSSQVKVWFQNRRMKWKRVKGGQQGAAAREKELVNVKKGRLLPSELSGVVALQCLAGSPRRVTEEDSHDSDQSSEHPPLWPPLVFLLRRELLLDIAETKETLVTYVQLALSKPSQQTVKWDSEHSGDDLLRWKLLDFALSKVFLQSNSTALLWTISTNNVVMWNWADIMFLNSNNLSKSKRSQDCNHLKPKLCIVT